MRRRIGMPSEGGGGLNTYLHFYAPLTEGNLADVVSGVEPTILNTSTAYVDYRSSMGAYRFVTSTGGQRLLTYNIAGINDYSPDFNLSIIVDVYVNSFTGTCDVLSMGSGKTDNNDARSTVETHRFTGFTAGAWHRLVTTWSNSNNVCLYVDGALVKSTTATSSNYKTWMLNTITNETILNNIVIGGGFSSYKYNAFFKDVMMLRKTLSAEEVSSFEYNQYL